MSLGIDALVSLGSFWLVFLVAVGIRVTFRRGRRPGQR